MASTQVTFSQRASNKALAHILKYQKHDCIGVLIGTRASGKLVVTDAVPLFHDRIMATALESALEVIELVHLQGNDIILGIYDSPLRFKADEVSLTPVAVSIAEQIKQIKETLDSVIVSIRVPVHEEEAEEAKVKEIRDDDELIYEAYAAGSTPRPMKIKIEVEGDRTKIVKELCAGGNLGAKVPKYFDIVDFDEHFADITLDWTNPQFN